LLERYINSRIIYNILDENSWHQYINQDDPVIIETLRIFGEGAAFPKRPEPKMENGKQQKVAWGHRPYDYSPIHMRATMVART
jgi:carboxyl-terminal processing protease